MSRRFLLPWSLVLLALWFGCSGAAMATAQQPDRIVLDGQIHALLSNPFEQCRRQYPDIELQWLRLSSVDTDYATGIALVFELSAH